MKNKVLLWEIGSFLFIGIVGAALHFTFEITDFKNMAVAFFSAVNESTWEHLKMVFWPGIFFAVIEYTYVREKVNNYLIAKTASLFVMPLVITLGWYLYTPFTQKSIYKVDLFLFYLAVLIGQIISYKLMTRSPLPKKVNNFATGSLVVMLIAFSTLTFNPPHMFLFEHLDLKDTGQFGILPYEDNIRYFTKPPSP